MMDQTKALSILVICLGLIQGIAKNLLNGDPLLGLDGAGEIPTALKLPSHCCELDRATGLIRQPADA
jgi:hypothetical protein